MKKRLLSILLTLSILFLLICAVLSGCGGSDVNTASEVEPTEAAAGSVAESAADGVKMTDSYREGRQAYYDITGIWMPEVEGFEAEFEADPEMGSICFDSHGDRELFEAAKAVLTDELGEPDSGEEDSASWAVDSADGKSTAYYDVIYYTEDGEWVFMNYHVEQSAD